jgi:23S rRNA (pseudouridine1915-N3)-methyltransferase
VQIALTAVDIVVVGAPPSALREAIADYERRLGRYVTIRVRECKGERLDRGTQIVRDTEGTRIMDAIASIERSSHVRPTVVVCDIAGRSMASEQLAERLLSVPRVVIVVGGACGVASRVRDRADLCLSFGALTLPHGMARLVLVEQLYRAHKIAHGEPYHH